MSGVADNLSAMLEDRYHRGGKYEDVTDRADAPIEDAVALMVRERLTGIKPPPAASKIVDLWRDFIEERAGRDLDGLLGAIENQRAFGRSVRDLLSSLEMTDEAMLDQDDEDQDEDSDSSEDQDQSEGDADEQAEGERADVEISDEAADDLEEGAQEAADAPSGELPDDADDADSEEASEVVASAGLGPERAARPGLPRLHGEVRRDRPCRGSLRSGRAVAAAGLSR